MALSALLARHAVQSCMAAAHATGSAHTVNSFSLLSSSVQVLFRLPAVAGQYSIVAVRTYSRPATVGRTMQQPGMHVQGQIKRAQQSNQDPAHRAKADVPAAVFERMERDDRLNVGFYLNQGPALTAILHGMKQLSWPTFLETSDTTRSALVVGYFTALMWGLRAFMLPKPGLTAGCPYLARPSTVSGRSSIMSVNRFNLRCFRMADCSIQHPGTQRNRGCSGMGTE